MKFPNEKYLLATKRNFTFTFCHGTLSMVYWGKNCKVKIFVCLSLKWTSCEVREGGQPERWNVYWNKVIREFRAEEHFVMSGQKVSILSPTFGRANGTDKHLFTRNPSIQRSRQRNYLGFFENRPEKENVTLVLSFIGSWSPKLQGVPKKM